MKSDYVVIARKVTSSQFTATSTYCIQTDSTVSNLPLNTQWKLKKSYNSVYSLLYTLFHYYFSRHHTDVGPFISWSFEHLQQELDLLELFATYQLSAHNTITIIYYTNIPEVYRMMSLIKWRESKITIYIILYAYTTKGFNVQLTL